MKKFLHLLTLLLFIFKSYSQGDQKIIQVPIDIVHSESALLHLPDDYSNTNNKYPLLVFLHGIGEAGNNLNKIYNSTNAGGPAYFIAHNQWPASFINPADGKAYKFIVLSPQNDSKWSTSGYQLEYVLSYMASNYHVDVSRIYLTGLSAGGEGIEEYVTHNGVTPTYVPAAIIPMSAVSSMPTAGWANTIVSGNTYTWGFGSDPQDVFGGFMHSLTDYINIVKNGYSRFTNYKGGHCCWNNFYNPTYTETVNGKQMNIYEWLLQYSRNSTVSTPPPTGQVTATAGPNKSVLLPVDSTILTGSGTSTNGTIVSYTWNVLNGPNTPTIIVPASGNTSSGNGGSGNNGNGNGNGNSDNGNGNNGNGNGNGNGNQGNGNGNQGNGNGNSGNEGPATSGSRVFTLKPDYQEYLVLDNSNNFYKPGDTIYLSGYFKSVAINNMSGSATSYIHIRNKPNEKLIIGDSLWNGGAYAQGMVFGNCHYIEVAGTDKLHFHVVGGNTSGTDGNGTPTRTAYLDFAIGSFSDNFKVHDISIRYGGAGLWAKTEIDIKNSATWYPNKYLNNFEFYNLEIRNTYNEAMYIGHTAAYWNIQTNVPYYPSSPADHTASSNPSVYKQPIKLTNVKIHDNYIHDIGNDGIQCAAIDNLEIYNNEVARWATKHGVNDQAGIMPGGRVKGFNIHDNYVHDSWGELMEVYAEGGAAGIINNNLFTHGQGEGISMRGGSGLNVQFTNNTVAYTNYHSVRVNGFFGQSGATFQKNIFITPIISFGNAGSNTSAYIYPENGATFTEGNTPNDDKKYATLNSSILDPNNYYEPTSNSPAKGYGYLKKQNSISTTGSTAFSTATAAVTSATATATGSPTIIVKGLVQGTYTFQLTIKDSKGNLATSQVNVVVKSSTPVPPVTSCSATGSILREEWDNINGKYISDLPVTAIPSSSEQITSLEFKNKGQYYGDRVRGYICPPQTGNYVFFIASDDASELYISTDSTPDNKSEIAYVANYVGYRDFNAFSTQTSATVSLIAGKKYYIEILHKQGNGADHLTVGWQLPDRTEEIPVAGSHLSPFISGSAMATAANMQKPNRISAEIEISNVALKVYPNPFQNNAHLVYTSSETGNISIDLYDMQGHRLKNLYTGVVNQGEVKNLNLDGADLSSGLYMIYVSSKTKIINQKIMLVK